MKDSKIEWTHHTFNPWIGCTRVSPGCVNCYAETMMADRYKKVKWGPTGERKRTSADYWKQPLKWNREAAAAGERRRVFVASLADVFEDKPDQRAEMDEWRDALFHYPILYDNLDWLFLTKRPENVMGMVHSLWLEKGFPPNVWIGTSIENQEYADKRIPELLKIPAAVRFLSVEPLLGPVDLNGFDNDGMPWLEPRGYEGYNIDWVIVGGESGHNARPMHPDWVRSIRNQCQDAGVPFLFKQWGEWELSGYDELPNVWVDEDTGETIPRHNTFPEPPPFTSAAVMKKVGKHRAGRLLDGREWNEFPEGEVAR